MGLTRISREHFIMLGAIRLDRLESVVKYGYNAE
jgi:hypothetical protein